VDEGLVTTAVAPQQDGVLLASYTAPQLVVIGKTVALVQGNQTYATYLDRYTSGMTSWPT
jgi:hypothetical protein